jgi:hypothetical protein
MRRAEMRGSSRSHRWCRRSLYLHHHPRCRLRRVVSADSLGDLAEPCPARTDAVEMYVLWKMVDNQGVEVGLYIGGFCTSFFGFIYRRKHN